LRRYHVSWSNTGNSDSGAYVLFRLGVFLYKKLKNMHIALPLNKLSNYNGHTTSVCIEALDLENSLLIPLCSIKTHPFDLITDGKIKLQITRYTRYCSFDSVSFNVMDNPIMTKSDGNVVRLTNTVQVSLFDRILLRKICNNDCSFSILLIANGLAREIDLSVSTSANLATNEDEYETLQETIALENTTVPKIEIKSEPEYSEMN
jgi:hypothetical protein